MASLRSHSRPGPATTWCAGSRCRKARPGASLPRRPVQPLAEPQPLPGVTLAFVEAVRVLALVAGRDLHAIGLASPGPALAGAQERSAHAAVAQVLRDDEARDPREEAVAMEERDQVDARDRGDDAAQR